ncbi:MAG: TlpA disulfide reductase family protein [Gammaproteobacteria bacterium]|nr:TlpA disulfide reductase family protein [Gammaproteobacteria bacterium]
MQVITSIAILALMLFGAGVARSEEDVAALLTPHKGKVVLIDFWASWCVPCLRSFPWMNELVDDLGPRGLSILAINVDSDRAEADRFLGKHPAKFSIVFDPHGEYARQLDVDVMPSSFLVDRDGRIVNRHRGFLSKDAADYRALIEAQLRGE